MSVVAWDGKHLVADNQVTHGNVPKRTTKAFRYQSNHIITALAFVGIAQEGLALVQWYKDGANPESMPDYPETELIACTSTQCASYSDSNPTPLVIQEQYYATGSGTDFATSALSLGLSARAAVLHAIEHDIYCGMGTTSIKLS